LAASELGSSSIEGGTIGGVLESASSMMADGSGIESLVAGSEDVLFGDATTEAFASGASELGDTLVVAAGDAGAGVLSIVPGWLLSGGLAALASELAFAVFTIFALTKAGGAVVGKRTDIVQDAARIASSDGVVATFEIDNVDTNSRTEQNATQPMNNQYED
jgi:hypothetical protein